MSHTPRWQHYEVFIVAWCGAVGLSWSIVATFLAFSLNLPPPTLDPPGLVRAVLLWPLLLGILISSGLSERGAAVSPFLISGALGIVVGVMAGLALVVLARRA